MWPGLHVNILLKEGDHGPQGGLESRKSGRDGNQSFESKDLESKDLESGSKDVTELNRQWKEKLFHTKRKAQVKV